MKLYFIFIVLILFSSNAYCNEFLNLYNQTPICNFKLHNNIDPYQDEDYFKYAYSPYPLFRTSSNLYFKNIIIPSGYYMLTPRKIKNTNVVLFKSNGKVIAIIPVVKVGIVPELFYKQHLPKVKKTKWQNFSSFVSNKVYKVFKGSKKEKPPKSFILVEKVENNMLVVKLYYENSIYYLVLNLIQQKN